MAVETQHHANIILGAGPAGIQLAYHFMKAGVPYLVLERGDSAATFFQKFPHSGSLISINKKNTGKTDPEFNLRHDWNSLLSEEGFIFPGTNFYPDRRELVEYLNEFARRFRLKIEYSSDVKAVKPYKGGYALETLTKAGAVLYSCDRLIVATGLSKAAIPHYHGQVFEAPKHYADFEPDYFKKPANLEKYRNKTLHIIGNGNSAYELANLLTPYCAKILIAGRNPKKMALSTHYTGDLRSVYMPFLDTFYLKSLNAINFSQGAEVLVIQQKHPGGPYKVNTRCANEQCEMLHEIYAGPVDHVIFCTGWRFDNSIFQFDLEMTPDMKYPTITEKYESTNNKNLFFIGALMHSHDYKQSSGGFIHGFRYLIQHFFRLNYTNQMNIQVFEKTDTNSILRHIMYKLNNASAIYQMYGHVVDILFFNHSMDKIIYINDVPRMYGSHVLEKYKPDMIAFISLRYGEEPVTELYDLGRYVSGRGKECRCTLLHPVITLFSNGILAEEIHLDEDIFAEFHDEELYTEKMRRALSGIFMTPKPS